LAKPSDRGDLQMTIFPPGRGPSRAVSFLADLSAPVLSLALAPLLNRVVEGLARKHPSIFDRLGPHTATGYVIDATNLPFALFLRPDPARPVLSAVARNSLPAHQALIRGSFDTLFELIDSDADGDAVFFSRDLVIEGNTEAVVSLRNALDDVDGSIAADAADLFGPPGRLALGFLRGRAGARNERTSS